MSENIYVIIPAGGIGTRMGLPYPKQLLPFKSSTLLQQTMNLFRDYPITVPVPATYLALFEEKIGAIAAVIIGGETRFDSVRLAFDSLGDLNDQDLIIIHDAARPFFNPSHLDAALELTRQRGAVIYSHRAVDTMKQVSEHGVIERTLDRNYLFHAQTPQIFKAGLLKQAYACIQENQQITDEAMLLELSGIPVSIFESDSENKKITNPEDLKLLEGMNMRIGHGYDVHKFDESRPLYLCGVEIPGGPGLLGHSDADVAMHALIDALLGAAGMGDIGHLFPDTDAKFKDIRSRLLLEEVLNKLDAAQFSLINADITIQAQIPKLAPHIEAMRRSLAEIINCPVNCINVKATTTEGLGFVGKKEGIAVDAVVLLKSQS